MRKGFLMVLAVVLVAAMAAPAMADLSTSGWVRIKGRVDSNLQTGGAAGAQGGTFILPGTDVSTASFVEQRQRFILDWKSENVGARAYFEIDFGAWGDVGYNVGRNAGAGLEADSINLETKNFYMWFNVPNTSVKVTAGLQNLSDSFQGLILGYADMAGIVVTGKMEPVEYRLGWAKFQEGSKTRDDDVDFYLAEVKFVPTKGAKLGVDFYVLRDASGSNTAATAGNGTNTTNLNTLGRAHADYWDPTVNPTAFTYQPATFYYLGVDGSFIAGPATLSGFALYNWGKIETLGGTIAGDNVAGGSTDLKAYALDLRADMAVGPGKGFLEFGYVSGTKDSDNDIKTIITGSNYALAGSYPFTRMDMQILIPAADEINSASSLAYDAQNKLRGMIIVAAGYSMKFDDRTSGKVGIGYMADDKVFVGQNQDGVSVKKHSATEINANVNYEMVKGLNLGLYGAYAFLSDWEDYGTGQNVSAVNLANMTRSADDIWRTYFRMNYAF
jgi:hypothetical protein